MKKTLLLILLLILGVSYSYSQTSPITAERLAYFTVPDSGDIPDTLLPYYGDLGVRRVIVADADGDGDQEILATDYTNGGRVHVMEVVQDSLLEIVWSSPAFESASGSSPRYIQVGDCDGDGNMEIIFPQAGVVDEINEDDVGRICIYEWDPGTASWGTAPSFTIKPSMVTAAGGREGLRLTREVLTVYDFDGDGKTEIIPHGAGDRKDVLILGITGTYTQAGGFASVFIEGGNPNDVTNGGDFVGGSFWNAIPTDINGDGKMEIINHHWDNYGFWSIDVEGPDSYTYPEATSVSDAESKGAYRRYQTGDPVSYMGASAVDVDGDGKYEIVGTQYQNSHNLAMISFPETASG
jgi:hypothetical protein